MRLPQRGVWLWLKESTCSDEYDKWLPRQTITHFKCTYALNIGDLSLTATIFSHWIMAEEYGCQIMVSISIRIKWSSKNLKRQELGFT